MKQVRNICSRLSMIGECVRDRYGKTRRWSHLHTKCGDLRSEFFATRALPVLSPLGGFSFAFFALGVVNCPVQRSCSRAQGRDQFELLPKRTASCAWNLKQVDSASWQWAVSLCHVRCTSFGLLAPSIVALSFLSTSGSRTTQKDNIRGLLSESKKTDGVIITDDSASEKLLRILSRATTRYQFKNFSIKSVFSYGSLCMTDFRRGPPWGPALFYEIESR